jgi:hypothetical protein
LFRRLLSFVKLPAQSSWFGILVSKDRDFSVSKVSFFFANFLLEKKRKICTEKPRLCPHKRQSGKSLSFLPKGLRAFENFFCKLAFMLRFCPKNTRNQPHLIASRFRKAKKRKSMNKP